MNIEVSILIVCLCLMRIVNVLWLFFLLLFKLWILLVSKMVLIKMEFGIDSKMIFDVIVLVWIKNEILIIMIFINNLVVNFLNGVYVIGSGLFV